MKDIDYVLCFRLQQRYKDSSSLDYLIKPQDFMVHLKTENLRQDAPGSIKQNKVFSLTMRQTFF